VTEKRGTDVRQLHQLARLYGVQTAYDDVLGHRRREASPEALLAVLQALGAEVENFRDVPAALRERRQAQWQRCCEPVVLAWDGDPVGLTLRLPAGLESAPVAAHLQLETGEVRRIGCDLTRSPTVRAAGEGGARYVVKRLALPGGLPWGYHQLTVEVGGKTFESLVIAAPLRACTSPGGQAGRNWGVILPLYALHSQRSWGGGDFTDLEALTGWVAGLGGGLVGTLPLLGAFLDEPFDPSPYAPASRLFWNELYLDVTRIPELEQCPTAQDLLTSSALREAREALRASPWVDYRREMALKRRVLEELARCLFAEASERQAALRRFVEAHPVLEDYARFRATCERRRAPWPAWPEPQREGVLTEGDYGEEARRYHLYVQWLAHEQLSGLSERARERGVGLYLDLPLGVHPNGYDVWRERALFVLDMCGGAPPDGFFIKGQNWGFPPLHPERIRTQGYRYTIACLRHHLAQASVLRIDHLMGLHRLFWIPPGMPAHEGVYVRYRAEEFYAILALESHRHEALIVGEDLGTVPPSVRPAMARHNIQRMYVLPFELTGDPHAALRPPAADSLAALNTHDMRPFAGFWQGLDIADRIALGLLGAADAQGERNGREALKEALISFFERTGRLEGPCGDAWDVLGACLAYLAGSAARIVMVNLEDLWLETDPQNTPGTREERPNWRRKTRYAFDAFCRLPHVVDRLREVDRQRKLAAGPR